MKAGSIQPSGGWRRGLRRAGGLWTIYAGSAARLLIFGSPTEMFAVELVSEVSAPLSAAKWCDDRRNHT